jgi:hypothetical protein
MKSIRVGFALAAVCALFACAQMALASGLSAMCNSDIWSPATTNTAQGNGYPISNPAPAIGVNWNASDVNLGDVFTSNVSGTVCALGIYAGNTNTNSETVGLYNSSGVLLTSITVTSTDPLYDGYLWAATTGPVAITAGQTYTVVDYTNGNGWGYGPAPITHGVTFDYNDYNYTSGLAYTTQGPGSGPAYYGSDVMLLPEGGSAMGFLLLAAAVTLGAMRLSKAGMVA